MLAKQIHDGTVTVGKAERELETRKSTEADPPHNFQNFRHREFLDAALRAGARYKEHLETVLRISTDGVSGMEKEAIDAVATEKEAQLKDQVMAIHTLAQRLRSARVVVAEPAAGGGQLPTGEAVRVAASER